MIAEIVLKLPADVTVHASERILCRVPKRFSKIFCERAATSVVLLVDGHSEMNTRFIF